MTARIARGGGGAARPRPRPKGRAPARGRGGRRADALPEAVRKVSWWILLGMLAMLGIAVLAAFGVPQTVGTSAAVALGEAGFAVKRVEVKGLDRMAKLPVYSVALDQESMAMPLVDLEGTRARLLKFGWIKDARVSRRLPDTLVVDIVERKPAAIWQHNQRLALIDAEGVVLEAVKLEAMPDLPVVIGAAANRHVPELSRLIDGAPQLKPMMAGASWVSGRRWDIRFQSGEVLALPEGAAAGKALTHFARLDQATQLLGRGFVRFDMRVPGKMIIRVSGVPGSSVPSLAPDIEMSAPGAAEPAPAPARPAPRLPVSNEPVDPRKTI